MPAFDPASEPCLYARRHWFYWVGGFTLRCKWCNAVKIADR